MRYIIVSIVEIINITTFFPFAKERKTFPCWLTFLCGESVRDNPEIDDTVRIFGKNLSPFLSRQYQRAENILEGALVFLDNFVIEEKDILFSKIETPPKLNIDLTILLRKYVILK